jgi:ribose-phosphate pyrophosphokinase
MLFFALHGSDRLGAAVAAAGAFARAPHEEREFDGGEHKARPLVDVGGQDVVVLHSLNGEPEASANDKLLRLLFFLAACREHGAARVTAIAPYLAYSRKDRQTKPHDPVTTRSVAQLFEAVGTSAVVTLEVHNLAAFQNAFRCRTLHLSTDRLFAEHIAARLSDRPAAIVSPDPGGVKRAQLLREALEEVTGAPVRFGFMEKRRSGGVVSGTQFAGDVDGCAVFLVDDMICGGGTILRAADAVRARGAVEVHGLATHALLTQEALAAFAGGGPVDSLALTDSVATCMTAKEALGDQLHVVGCAPLIAAAIRQLHSPDFRVSPAPAAPSA